MFFTVKLYPHFSEPLVGLIGRDGNLYWRVVNVGKLLLPNGVSSLSKRYSKTHASDVVPGGVEITPSAKKTVIMSTYQLVELLDRYDKHLSEKFSKFISEGKCEIEREYLKYSTGYRNTIEVIAFEGGRIDFCNWIQMYVEETLERWATFPICDIKEETIETGGLFVEINNVVVLKPKMPNNITLVNGKEKFLYTFAKKL